MNLINTVNRLARVSLALTFVVIIAGSIVRITGSGMGCPDWPKCFGYFIPPTDVSALIYEEGRNYGEGQMVLRNDTLWVATEPLLGVSEFHREDWYKYPKHDYATFNVLHTWVEYVNRLATVVYGIPVFLLALFSLLMLIKRGDWGVFLLAAATILMVGFEAWLGKLVVDGNLIENSITYHMFGSVALVALLSMIVFRLSDEQLQSRPSTGFKRSLLTISLLLFIQILLGTQVREQVDVIAKMGDDRSLWVEMLPFIFKIHRSFSLVILAVAIAMYVRSKSEPIIVQFRFAIIVLLAEILTGVVLAYVHMPVLAQPLHLFLGVLCFGLMFYAWLRAQFRGC